MFTIVTCENTNTSSTGRCQAGDYEPTEDSRVRYSSYSITCYANGNKKTIIYYRNNGSTLIFGIGCYKENGDVNEVLCHPTRHSLPNTYMTVTYHDPPDNTKVASYIQYIDTDKTRKLDEITYYNDDGNSEKTVIYYQYDDSTKSAEYTYWENGNEKTVINYQADGSTVREIDCYDDSKNHETCTQEKHGCTSTSTTCITN